LNSSPLIAARNDCRRFLIQYPFALNVRCCRCAGIVSDPTGEPRLQLQDIFVKSIAGFFARSAQWSAAQGRSAFVQKLLF
jgi:hypothetical protein